MLLLFITFLSSLSIIIVFTYFIIYSQDYLSNIIEIIYFMLITLYSINKVVLSSLLSFLFLNIGSTALYISIKAFIWISMIVGNIIDIYIYGLIAVLINWLLYYSLFGLICSSFLLYLFSTKIEFFLFILFYLESFSSLFQSLTLANRLSINLLAGSLLIALLSLVVNYIIYYLILGSLITLFLFIVFLFEILNSCIQLFIFSLLTLEYSGIYCFIFTPCA